MRRPCQVAIELQKRDLMVLAALMDCRVMTLSHISQLYFSGKGEAAKKRVQKLKAAGFLLERRRSIGKPSILRAGKKALTALFERGWIDNLADNYKNTIRKRQDISDQTLRHELELMDIRTSFLIAMDSRPDLTLADFKTSPASFQFAAFQNSIEFGRRKAFVQPDGFISVEQRTKNKLLTHMFFVELDRSTESERILMRKALYYLGYYQSGQIAVRFGGTAMERKRYPFRVLMIFQSNERLRNAALRLLNNNPPILTMTWLTTTAEITSDPLGAIWMRPRDFEPAKPSMTDQNKRGEGSHHGKSHRRWSLFD